MYRAENNVGILHLAYALENIVTTDYRQRTTDINKGLNYEKKWFYPH